MTDRIPLQIVGDKSRQFPRIIGPMHGSDYATMADPRIGVQLATTGRDLFGTGYPDYREPAKPVGISGERYVIHVAAEDRWCVQIGRAWIGRYRTIAEAVVARDAFMDAQQEGIADAA